MEVYDSSFSNVFLREMNIFIIFMHHLKYIIKFRHSYWSIFSMIVGKSKHSAYLIALYCQEKVGNVKLEISLFYIVYNVNGK